MQLFAPAPLIAGPEGVQMERHYGGRGGVLDWAVISK